MMSDKEWQDRQEYFNSKKFTDHVISTTKDITYLQKEAYKAGHVAGALEKEKEIQELKKNIDKLQDKIESLLNA